MSYYIFVYCTTHDDGKIIKSNKPRVPDNLDIKCVGCDKSFDCDYIYNGTVHSNGEHILEIEKVYKDLHRYGGGFKFEFYKDCTNDELLKNWIVNNL